MPPTGGGTQRASIADLFIRNTSLRGFAKLARPDQRPFLRLLWAAFVVSMMSVLLLSCYSLLFEYFQYHVSSQLDQMVTHASPFPSVTICSHQPFSRRAPDLWASGRVPSPANYSRRVRRAMRDFLALGRYQDAREVFQNDRLTSYFQNLEHDQIAQLGHEQGDLLLFCVMRHSHNTNPSVAHEDQCQYRVRRIIHPLYFNCYTFDVDKDPNYVSSVSMVISGGGQVDVGMTDQVYNLFEEAAGLVIVLHEPGTYPDTDAEQYKVQLGTASTIRYTSERHERYRSPKTDCMLDWEVADSAPQITQYSDTDFQYTHSACISQRISDFIAGHCNCTSAFHLNSRPLMGSLPYCSRLDGDGLAGFEAMLSRITCARNISLADVYAEAVDGNRLCRHRCVRWRYSVEQSTSDWRPLGTQLRWMETVSTVLSSNNTTGIITNLTKESTDVLDRFFIEGENADWTDERPASDEGMAMVTIVRETFTTLHQTEKPVITLSTLVSRLGGVGSLTLGITLTVAFELVELAYLLLAQRANCADRPAAESRAANRSGINDVGREDKNQAELLHAIRMDGVAVRTVAAVATGRDPGDDGLMETNKTC